MARITVEDCLNQVTNRFGLVLLATKRTRQLLGGAKVLLSEPCSNKAVVTSLREIADGAVRFMSPEDERIAREKQEQLEREAAARRAELEAQRAAQAPAAESTAIVHADTAVSEATHSENGHAEIPDVNPS